MACSCTDRASPELRGFEQLDLADVRRHRACGCADCRRCKATALPGAMERVEAGSRRRFQAELRQRLESARRSGLGITQAMVREHPPCGEAGCLLCKATAYPEVMSALPPGRPSGSRSPAALGLPGTRDRSQGRSPSPSRCTPSVTRTPWSASPSALAPAASPAERAVLGARLDTCDLNATRDESNHGRVDEVLGKGTCPLSAAAEALASDEEPTLHTWAGQTIFVSPTAPKGNPGTADAPLQWTELRTLLEQRVLLPDTTFLLRSRDPSTGEALVYEAITLGGSRSSTTSECWDHSTWGQMLLVRACGLPDQPLTITSADEDFQADPGLDNRGSVRAVLDGGHLCNGELCDNQGQDTARGRAITLESASYIVLRGLTFRRFTGDAVWVLGDSEEVRITGNLFEDSAQAGLVFNACPDLTQDAGDFCGNEREEDMYAYTHARPAWLPYDHGYPRRIEVDHNLFRDNGDGTDSAATQFFVGFYCTALHIHHNMLYQTPPTLEAWPDSTEPPPATLMLHVDTDGLTESCGATCSDCSDEKLSTSSALGCATWTTVATATEVESLPYKNCDTADTLSSADALARSRALTGTEAGELPLGCQRRGGDAFTFQGCSSGHVIEYNVIVGHNKICAARQQPPWTNPDGGQPASNDTEQDTDPPLVQPDVVPACCDTSDGDGIDFKGLRQRTRDSDPFTIVAHNLFLFNEGPAITTHNGTIGLEIYRNVMAGNGTGITLIAGNNTHFLDEWTVRDDVENVDREVRSYTFIEQGCYRIYRNLIYNNNRIDADCGTGGKGTGILINGTGVVELRDGAQASAGTVSHRFRDIWIVNNVLAGHEYYGLNAYRHLNRYDSQTDEFDLDHASQILGLHVLNNLIVNNATAFVGLESDKAGHINLGGKGDLQLASFRDVELDTFTIDSNWYYPPLDDGDPATEPASVRYQGTPRSLWWFYLDSEEVFEAVYFSSSESVVVSENQIDPGLRTPAGTWSWPTDAWEQGWRTGEPDGLLWWAEDLWMPSGDRALPAVWESLPSADWAPRHLDLQGGAPPTGWQTGSVGIPDRGVYRRTGALVNVGSGPDIFYTAPDLDEERELAPGVVVRVRSNGAVGAWNPSTWGPSTVEDLGQGYTPILAQPPEQAIYIPPDWTQIWQVTDTPPPVWFRGLETRLEDLLTLDTLQWAFRSRLIGPSRQVLVNQWGGR